MKHFSHEHPLILNEVYIAKEGDACRGCLEEIVSCRSFVYSCSSPNSTRSTDDKCVKFLLHKSCAELPPTIKHPDDHDVSLYIHSHPIISFSECIICGCELINCSGFIYKRSDEFDEISFVCARCAMASLEEDRIYRQHPAHPQHTLNFVQHLSSFKCDACKVVDDNIKDLSYKCTKCRFLIHKSCADAPASFQFQFHDKHPLKLSFSLPELYQMFDQYCRLCSEKLYRRQWLYYCPKCRFFAHFHCARSNEKISLIEDAIYDSDAVHLPAADETSADQLAEQFVMAMSTIIRPNCFRHWDHDDHDLQLMTINELNDKKHDDEILILCNACVKPIRTDHGHENHFYGCVSCNYFMHKACAGLRRKIEHRLQPRTIMQTFTCDGCHVVTTGIAFEGLRRYRFHIGCVTLPEKIKHEAHSHQLNQVFIDKHACKACRSLKGLKYCCEKCNFYVCGRCIMKPRTIKHRWDTHPLSLIYDPSMVDSDHEHEFDCEFCSEEIDTNYWFYHCSDCDLSFHTDYNCIESSLCRKYSNIKYGAVIYAPTLHDQDHSLTLVLNKKFRTCEICQRPQIGYPVLECAPCKVIFCGDCADRWKYG